MKKIITENKWNLLLMGLMAAFAVFWFNRQLKVENGEQAPDFESLNMQRENIKLSDYEGNLILLDFWGSWCGPCRTANGSLVHLHNKYHNARFKKAKGFVIFSVGIERNEENWLRAIKQDGLVWDSHVSDFKRFGSPIAKLYGVHEIPTTFLLSENRTILGVNLSYQELEEALHQRLK